jgi:hypothetical protein
MESANETSRRFTLKDIFFLPFGCLFTASPYVILGGLLVLALLGVFVYYNLNIDFFAIGAPDFQNYTITPAYDHIQTPDQAYWQVAYEKPGNSQFHGLVRHISPIRIEQMPILTHDVLITSGDYSDSDLVSTSVIDHHFFWRSATTAHPQGTINLLHTVPRDRSIYEALLKIHTGDTVTITGREILKIDAYDHLGKLLMWWADSGCNSLRVDDVTWDK